MRPSFTRLIRLSAGTALALCFTAAAHAQAPSVVASIKPVHSLVAAVMDGVGEPALLLDANASPHTYALRPSDAQALSGAELVVWVGPGVEAFLGGALDNLADGAQVLELSELPTLTQLDMREGGMFEAHAHGGEEAHDHGAGEEQAHDHSDDGDHAGHDDHADHDHGAHDDDHAGHDHAHGEHDAHLWLDPANAVVMVEAISERLAEIDPDHAERYRENAQAEVERLTALREEIAETLSPVTDRPFMVFHDAFQYFENAFGVGAVASVTINPEVTPGARRITELQQRIEDLDVRCLISEPQFPREMVDLLTTANTRTAVMDPIGVDLAAGPNLYGELMRANAQALAGCLADPA